ncbi:ABC transporter permease (plasmid) [Sinorhizobium meliloti WSM1022]|uniref:ABC transporter permease subunit n=2 Tax=Rhizobium meliloti TaxID=382 RepID=A0A6A7ZRR3_RHIML|nr:MULTISPECIES: ABC transporter permease [Sinorhizobium]MDE3823159.1 ABC transporter permease [Sinorhizobium meliloti]MDW9627386.1 ABC transporter permease subunit [Sinorhizobium meliloti]MDW9646543.1 ABC transporter permease subunit [Sinorhizobium meliloti]MDW9844305.1 ABC transporter permease subunit [Sinorhizobium meliloti]MDW9899867.1 ABC transporter permease subunit [Sinorhizobium meliloti]
MKMLSEPLGGTTPKQSPKAIAVALRRTTPSAWFGVAIIVLYALIAIFAPLIAPYGETEVVSSVPYGPWTQQTFLGTDQLGRDVFSRLIFGARNTIGISLAATMITFVVGVSLGITAAVLGGVVDMLMSRIVDAIMALPQLVVILVMLSVVGSSVFNLIVLIGIAGATNVFRLARSVSLNVTVMDYVEDARVRGESLVWIVFREVLPNILPTLVAEFGMRFCFVVLTISALSFLGLGIQPPTADWGSMVRESATLISYGDVTPLLPAAAIAFLAIGVNFVVDWFLNYANGLRDDH